MLLAAARLDMLLGPQASMAVPNANHAEIQKAEKPREPGGSLIHLFQADGTSSGLRRVTTHVVLTRWKPGQVQSPQEAVPSCGLTQAQRPHVTDIPKQWSESSPKSACDDKFNHYSSQVAVSSIIADI